MSGTDTYGLDVPALRALTRAFVPEAETLGEREWREVEALVNRTLAERPAALRRQLSLFLAALRVLVRLRTGRGLQEAPAERLRSLLRGLSRLPVLAVRRGVWGLRTLCFLGYYGREEAARALGYAAHPRGRQARA